MGCVVIVTGSRGYTDYGVIYDALEGAAPKLVIQGGARGADSIAKRWCHETGVSMLEVPALWDAYGKAAGTKRNELMLKVGMMLANAKNIPLVVLAFPIASSVGTRHMMKIAAKAGIEVRESDF